MGEAKSVLPAFVKEHSIGAVVTDFSPLRTPVTWVSQVKDTLPDNVLFCKVGLVWCLWIIIIMWPCPRKPVLLIAGDQS